jgi:hypothetical protein
VTGEARIPEKAGKLWSGLKLNYRGCKYIYAATSKAKSVLFEI